MLLARPPPVTGKPLETSIQMEFAKDMHVAGFTVNWFTFQDGSEHPSVYGPRHAILAATRIPLCLKNMGCDIIAWPRGDV